MSAGLVIVLKVRSQDTPQVPFAKSGDMVQALAAHCEPMSRSAKGFCHGLCGAVTASPIVHAFHTLPEGVTVHCVAVAKEVGRCGIFREGLDDLPGRSSVRSGAP